VENRLQTCVIAGHTYKWVLNAQNKLSLRKLDATDWARIKRALQRGEYAHG
jgi:hypothetical protein